MYFKLILLNVIIFIQTKYEGKTFINSKRLNLFDQTQSRYSRYNENRAIVKNLETGIKY